VRKAAGHQLEQQRPDRVNIGSGVNRVGGRLAGGNSCDDATCSVVALRRYYQTDASFDGSQALEACGPGFHMASIAELSTPSTLGYATTLGSTRADSGQGAPGGFAWIRTGQNPLDTSIPGSGNCAAWTNTSFFGTAVTIEDSWSDAAEAMSPWRSVSFSCSTQLPVWCVED